jgi:hypothetical protein
MKALLITKCGCSKMMDLANFDQDIMLPLHELNVRNEFGKRRFKYEQRQVIDVVEIYVYKEV